MWTIFAIHHYHEWKLFSQTVVKSNYSSIFLTYRSFSSEFPRYKTDKPRSTMDRLSTLPQPNRNATRVAAKLKIKPNLEPPASWQNYRGHYQNTAYKLLRILNLQSGLHHFVNWITHQLYRRTSRQCSYKDAVSTCFRPWPRLNMFFN